MSLQNSNFVPFDVYVSQDCSQVFLQIFLLNSAKLEFS